MQNSIYFYVIATVKLLLWAICSLQQRKVSDRPRQRNEVRSVRGRVGTSWKPLSYFPERLGRRKQWRVSFVFLRYEHGAYDVLYFDSGRVRRGERAGMDSFLELGEKIDLFCLFSLRKPNVLDLLVRAPEEKWCSKWQGYWWKSNGRWMPSEVVRYRVFIVYLYMCIYVCMSNLSCVPYPQLVVSYSCPPKRRIYTR